MTKSALQIARAAYQPKLPKALASGAVKAVAGAATQSVADQEAIKALFPNLSVTNPSFTNTSAWL